MEGPGKSWWEEIVESYLTGQAAVERGPGMKTGNFPNIPSIQKWINKLWLIHILKYYSAIERNKLLIHTKTWMNLKCIRLCKRSPTQKLWESIYMTFWKKIQL